jgi:uncharacterized metal-binding protein
MKEKISLVPCSGLIPQGLIARTACTDVVEESESVISICITAAAAELEGIKDLVDKYPIITVNCCENACTDKILNNKEIKVTKTINTTEILTKENLNPKNISRLDAEDEKCVLALKNEIKELLK